MTMELSVGSIFSQSTKDAQRKIIVGFIDWCEREGIDLVRNFGEGDSNYRHGDNLDPLIDKYQTFLDQLVIAIQKGKTL